MADSGGCPRCGLERAQVYGVEVRGVYDGVLYWQCPAPSCGHAWHRFSEGHHLRRRAEGYVAGANVRHQLDAEAALACPHCGAEPDAEGQRACGWEPYMDDPDEWGDALPERIGVRPCRLCGGAGVMRYDEGGVEGAHPCPNGCQPPNG